MVRDDTSMWQLAKKMTFPLQVVQARLIGRVLDDVVVISQSCAVGIDDFSMYA